MAIKTALPNLYTFLQHVSTGRVLADQKGKILFINKAAQKLLGKKASPLVRELSTLLQNTLKYKNDLVEDFPIDGQVLRFQTQYIKTESMPVFVIATVVDATEDSAEEKEKEIFEHIANISAQIVPTIDWIRSLLNKVTILKKVIDCSVMLNSRTEKKLYLAVSSSNSQVESLDLKIGEGIAGLAAKEKKIVVTTNTAKDKRYKPHPKFKETDSSLLSIPMVVGTKLIGVLNVRDKAGKFFREKDRSFYTILANRLAITLDYRSIVDQLREDFARLDTVINNTGEGMLLLERDGKIVMANPAVADLLDEKIDEIKGKKITEILPELEQVINAETPDLYCELELTSLEGNPWVGVYASHIEHRQDKNIVLTVSDITAEKQLEQIKNDFIATATHELRTPLTAILGYLSMLQNMDQNFEPKQKLYLHRIGQASQNLSALVEDLLSVLRIEQGSVRHKPQAHKILPLIREIVHTLESKIIAKKIKVSLPTKDYKIFADVNALQKVLINLIDNAIKYSPIRSKINVRMKPINLHNKKFIRIEIQDSGVGIPKPKQKRLFEKFYRVPNELSVEAGGTGLGLYITKKLVEEWGGEIRLAQSGPNGSTFAFTIPCA